jgi:hypothetical protein
MKTPHTRFQAPALTPDDHELIGVFFWMAFSSAIVCRQGALQPGPKLISTNLLSGQLVANPLVDVQARGLFSQQRSGPNGIGQPGLQTPANPRPSPQSSLGCFWQPQPEAGLQRISARSAGVQLPRPLGS